MGLGGFSVRIVALVSIVALNLIGCVSNGSLPDDVDNPTLASPLDEFLVGSGRATSGMSPAERDRLDEERLWREQELIAECMAQAGFEYVPTLANIFWGDAERRSQMLTDDRDWVIQWGYGHHDSPVGPLNRGEGVLPPDANIEIRENLGDAERTAYWIALRGLPPEPGSGAVETRPLEELGCQGNAWVEVNPLWGAEFAALDSALGTIWGDIANHPEMLAAELDWSDCMADAGFVGLAQQRDASSRIAERLSRPPGWAPPVGVFDWDLPEGMSLPEYEISIALADLDCRNSTDYVGRATAARYAVETQFVMDHRVELKAFSAAMEQAD